MINYLREHPGVDVFSREMEDALGEPRRRIMDGMGNLLNDPSRDQFTRDFANDIVKVSSGVWRYQPKGVRTDAGKKLFTEVGETKEGWLVLECEDGRLFKAEQL